MFISPCKRTSTEAQTQHGPGRLDAVDDDQCSQTKAPRVSSPVPTDNGDSRSDITTNSTVDPESAKEGSREDPMPTNSDSDDDNSTVIVNPTTSEPDAMCDHWDYTVSTAGHSLNIGLSIKPGMMVKEVSIAAAALSLGEKYKLLFRHILPPAFLPTTPSYGCKCKFSTDWLKKYQWLVYSPADDGAYCAPCALLC